jgi:glutamate racemase
MATTATIRSEKFLNIYKTHFTPNITLLPCPNLAYLIEQNKFSDVDNYLENILKNYKKIEVVVL